jgi:Arc/MetJ-type ribon-helix-helix transcriptional regulator
MTTITPAEPARSSHGSGRQRGPATRGRSAIHVDLGDDLKADVAAAARDAGVSPSDWVRSALRRAAGEGGSPSGGGRPWAAAPAPRFAESVEEGGATRPVAIHLAPDDIALIDAVMDSGGFRSRPAAVRYLVRVAAGGDGALAALRSLPELLPRLVDSNIELRSATRKLRAGDPDSVGRVWQRIDAQLLLVAQAMAALQPLLRHSGRPEGVGGTEARHG